MTLPASASTAAIRRMICERIADMCRVVKRGCGGQLCINILLWILGWCVQLPPCVSQLLRSFGQHRKCDNAIGIVPVTGGKKAIARLIIRIPGVIHAFYSKCQPRPPFAHLFMYACPIGSERLDEIQLMAQSSLRRLYRGTEHQSLHHTAIADPKYCTCL